MAADILTCHFRTVFEDVLTPLQRDQAVNSLKDYIFELQNGTDDQLRELEVIGEEDTDAELVQRKANATLERCYWQLVMFLRSTRPSRITEAEPYLRVLLNSPTITSDSSRFHEINTNLHLAAALTASPSHCGLPSQHIYVNTPTKQSSQSRDDEALTLFSHSFALYDTPGSPSSSASPVSPISSLQLVIPSPQNALGLSVSTPPSCPRRRCLPLKTELWARASYIRLLRRLGREDEAARQDELIREYIRSHPYALPVNKYRALIRDLSVEFGLDLQVSDEEPIQLVTPDIPGVIVHDTDIDSPLSPTFSLPSSISTLSDSSVSSSPVTPSISLLPVETLTSSKSSFYLPAYEIRLEVPRAA